MSPRFVPPNAGSGIRTALTISCGSRELRAWQRIKVTFCCRPPGPPARRERREPGPKARPCRLACQERATKPAGPRAAARRGAAAGGHLAYRFALRSALPLLDGGTASPASRRLRSARPALAPKCSLYSLPSPKLDIEHIDIRKSLERKSLFPTSACGPRRSFQRIGGVRYQHVYFGVKNFVPSAKMWFRRTEFR